MSAVTIDMYDPDRLAPATREAISIARREATRMPIKEVYPEQLLLGLVIQGDEKVMKALHSLGIDSHALLEKAPVFYYEGPTEKSGPQPSSAVQVATEVPEDLPLSRQALECINWALHFATEAMHSPFMKPEHLLLSVLRHRRMRCVIVRLLPAMEPLLTSLLERVGSEYTTYMDQLIRARVVELPGYVVRDAPEVSLAPSANVCPACQRAVQPQVSLFRLAQIEQDSAMFRDLCQNENEVAPRLSPLGIFRPAIILGLIPI